MLDYNMYQVLAYSYLGVCARVLLVTAGGEPAAISGAVIHGLVHMPDSCHRGIGDSGLESPERRNSAPLRIDCSCSLPCVSKAVSYPHNADGQCNDHLHEGIWLSGVAIGGVAACDESAVLRLNHCWYEETNQLPPQSVAVAASRYSCPCTLRTMVHRGKEKLQVACQSAGASPLAPTSHTCLSSEA
jgi:hypothetical protein